MRLVNVVQKYGLFVLSRHGHRSWLGSLEETYDRRRIPLRDAFDASTTFQMVYRIFCSKTLFLSRCSWHSCTPLCWYRQRRSLPLWSICLRFVHASSISDRWNYGMGEKPRVPAPVDSSLHSPALLIIALCFFLCLRLYRGVPKENDEIGQVLPYLSPLQSQVQAALYPSIVHPPYYPTCVQISMPNPLFSSCTLAYDCFGAREAARSFICWYCPYVAVLRFKCQDSRIE